MMPFYGELFGNPSSSHWAGRLVAPHLTAARQRVADMIGASPSEIFFTAGGSEGDNLAIRGALQSAGAGSHVITTTVEHPAVHSTCRILGASGYGCTFVEVGPEGDVNPDDVMAAVTDRTALISVMLANNETGVMNSIAEIAREAGKRGILVHTDAVQAVGKIPVNVRELGVDILTASGHKFNAPKGVGFQYVREGVNLAPVITGGHQEGGLRAGTENVAGIAGIAKACEIAMSGMHERMKAIGALRDRLESGLRRMVPQTHVNGGGAKRIYNTSNISFKYIEGEALMALLDSKGIAVSTGSACSSGSMEPSRVLTAMKLDPLCSRGAIRFSLGYGTTDADIDYCLEVIPELALRLQGMSPFGG